jgi:hypothetical protein
MNTTDDLGKLPHWELDSIFPGLDSEPFLRAMRELAAQLDGFDKFMVEHGITAFGNQHWSSSKRNIRFS